MKKVTGLTVAFILVFSGMLLAVVLPPPGHKFCKNNPTMNTGVCTYSGNKVEDCLNSINAIKDCYGIGID